MKQLLKIRGVYLLCLILLILPSTLRAGVGSTKNVVHHRNAWFNYAGTHRVSEKWGLHTLTHLRRTGPIDLPLQHLSRLGLQYYLSQKTFLSAGGDLLISHSADRPALNSVHLKGIWQAVVNKSKYNKFEITQRHRFEQNWSKPLAASKHSFAYVFRYLLQFKVPLNEAFFITANDEVFIAFGKQVVYNNFTQNRLNIGFGINLPKGNFQLSYMNQILKVNTGTTYDSNHTLVVALNYSLDLRKKSAL